MNFFERMSEMVISTFRQRKVPYIFGHPGIGKTSLAANIARNIGAKSFIICLSHKEPTEVHGNQIISKDTRTVNGKNYTIVEQAPPAYAVEAHESKIPVVIVYDELTCVPPSTAAPTLAILGEHRIGDIFLDPDKVGIMGCGNPPSIAVDGYTFAAPTANRLRFLEYNIDPIDWADQFISYWGNPPKLSFAGQYIDEGIWQEKRSLVSTFIKFKPEMLIQVPESVDAQGDAWPSPRTWDAVSRALADCQQRKLDFSANLIRGDVGSAATHEFVTWMDSLDVVPARVVLDDPSKFILPDRDDKLFYFVQSIKSEVRHRIKNAENTTKKAVTESALRGWENALNLFVKMLELGASKDILVIAVNEMIKSGDRPKNSKLPKGLSQFVTVIDSAALNWSE